MTQQFFMAMDPPTVTAQEHRIGKTKSGRMVTYDSPELLKARSKLLAHLAQYRPAVPAPAQMPVELHAVWCFPASSPVHVGQYRTSRPDTDNLQKLLKDCMTKVGFWTDDAQVCREIVEKFWSDKPGIFIRITELEENRHGSA